MDPRTLCRALAMHAAIADCGNPRNGSKTLSEIAEGYARRIEEFATASGPEADSAVCTFTSVATGDVRRLRPDSPGARAQDAQ